jgi:hypothetical protein
MVWVCGRRGKIPLVGKYNGIPDTELVSLPSELYSSYLATLNGARYCARLFEQRLATLVCRALALR